jgi:integrase
LGEIDIRAVSTLQIQDWVDGLSLAGVGNETIRGSAGAVRQILSLAHKKGLIAKTPWVAITLPGAKRSRKAKAFNESDFLRLAKECGPHELLVLVLGLCGLRIGEATALQKKHLNLKQGIINVHQAWHRDKAGKRHLGPPKNGEEREVPIPPRLVQELTTLWETIDEEDYLFVGTKGGPLNGDFFRKKWFRPAAQRLGLTGATVHMLRHTCASLLIRIGTPITTVSAILGHSGVEITLKTYAHFYVEDSFAAMAKLSDHIDSFTE